MSRDKLAPRRARSGSLVTVEKMDSTNDQVLDQEVYPNVNADWVNLKGAHCSLGSSSKRSRRLMRILPFITDRRMGHPRRTHRYGQDYY